jgi:hypothetical protein
MQEIAFAIASRHRSGGSLESLGWGNPFEGSTRGRSGRLAAHWLAHRTHMARVSGWYFQLLSFIALGVVGRENLSGSDEG